MCRPTEDQSRAVTTVNVPGGELSHGWPQFLPDGRRFLFYVRNRDRAASGTYVSSIDSQGQRLVLASSVRALYSPTGHLLFERAGNLMAQAFDDTSAMLTGQAMALPDRVVALSGPAWLPVSVGTDAVAYWSGDGRPTFDLDVVDRSGRAIQQVLPPGQYTRSRPVTRWVSRASDRAHRLAERRVVDDRPHDRCTGAVDAGPRRRAFRHLGARRQPSDLQLDRRRCAAAVSQDRARQ